MSATETAVATRRPGTIRERLEGPDFKSAIAQVLPKHLTPERMVRVAIVALTKTPKLAECDQASLFGAMLTLSQLGLEPDGRRAHLIPYGKTCQLVIDYKGLVELAMRSGDVSNIHADVICRNDDFESNMGRISRHVFDLSKERGDVIGAYAICRFKDGSEKAEILSKSEIDGIRKRSRAGNSGPWVTDYNEMAKKTAFRRLSKWLPLSPEYRDALDKDADSLPPIRPAIDVQAPVFVMPPSEIPEATTSTEGGEL